MNCCICLTWSPYTSYFLRTTLHSIGARIFPCESILGHRSEWYTERSPLAPKLPTLPIPHPPPPGTHPVTHGNGGRCPYGNEPPPERHDSFNCHRDLLNRLKWGSIPWTKPRISVDKQGPLFYVRCIWRVNNERYVFMIPDRFFFWFLVSLVVR